MATTQLSEQETKLNQAEKAIEDGAKSAVRTGQALETIRDERLYKTVLEFETFEDYCKLRWGFTARRANQLIQASKAMANLQKNTKLGSMLPKNTEDVRSEIPNVSSVRQMEELAKVPKDEQPEVWNEAVETAKAKGKDKPTAKDVKEAVEKRKADEPMAVSVIDDNGNSIPEHLLPAFTTMAHDELLTELRSLQQRVNSYLRSDDGRGVAPWMKNRDGVHYWYEIQQFIGLVKDYGKPSLVCLDCNGRGSTAGRDCVVCRARGWIGQKDGQPAQKRWKDDAANAQTVSENVPF